MEASGKALEETSNPVHCVELFATAEAPGEIFHAIQIYLDSWSKERVESLQRVDGGWAPFDHAQRPSQINGVRDLRRVSEAIHRQCVTLRQAGMAIAPELIELNEIFITAVQMAESLKISALKSRSPAPAPHAETSNPL